MRRLFPLVCGMLLAGGAAAPARADLVFLSGGRTVSVKAYRVDGGRAVLTLRNGGEIVCDAALVARVEPDEVAYPEEAVSVELDANASGRAAPRLVAGGPLDGVIGPLAARHRVDVDLVRAVVETESGYRARARSPKGAMGLMQLMPATARQYALSDPYDPESNLDAGIRHLRMLLDRYDVAVALAAYNAGEGAVARHGGVPPYPETREYVARVLRRAGLDRAAGESASAATRRHARPAGLPGPRS